MRFRKGPGKMSICACAGLLAGGAHVLLREDERSPPPVVSARGPAAAAVPREAAPRVPSLLPPAVPLPSSPSAPETCALVESAESPAAVASSTWAALSTALDDEAPDEDEALARRLLGGQMIDFLAEEDDADAALIWAAQLAELARWLAEEDRERLLSMARDDAAEARRRAAFVALGWIAAEEPTLVPALAAAWMARPTPEARLGLEDAVTTLRGRGLDARTLEEALRRTR